MASSSPPTGILPLRVHQAGEGIVVGGLALAVAGTTLCLGGFLADTMVFVFAAISAIAGLAALVWSLGLAGERRTFNWAALVPLPFLLYALVSGVQRAPAGWLAWREWLLWWQMWLVFVVTLHLGRGRRLTAVTVGAFAMLGLLAFVMAAYQRAADPSWLPLGRTQAPQFLGRSSGMFGIPNSLAGYIDLCVPACLGLALSTSVRSTVKVVAGWFAVLLLTTLALTTSRGGWLSLALALLGWALVGGGLWMRRLGRFVAVLTILGLALGGLYFGSSSVRERLDPLLGGQLELTRPVMWKAAVTLWLEAPLWGQGAGAFNVLFDRHRPEGFGDEPLWVHNDYLNILCDHGAAGLVLWGGAGAVLLVLGWRAARQARRKQSAAVIPFGLGKWKMGLWVGLIAVALHLTVEFHTKIPALGFAAAMAAALMLRDDERLRRNVDQLPAILVAMVLLSATAVLGLRVALPLYRAEALRSDARRAIDRYARGHEGDYAALLRRTKPQLAAAVRIDPGNGQAWADLAYVTSLGASLDPLNRPGLGRFAELAAEHAIKLNSQSAEFWVRKGVALDLQGGRPDAELYFRRALALAPKSAVWWFYYARHLQRFPERNAAAGDAVATCLALDPYYPGAESLRQQLVTRR